MDVKKLKPLVIFLIVLSALLIIFAIIIPVIVLYIPADGSHFTLTQSGSIGDTLGGTMNPFIAIAAAILTFLAFYIQYLANQDIRNQFKIQQFESQFYEMLRIHGSNVQEMDIANEIKGRKCFMRMFYEFEFIYLSLYEIHETHKERMSWNYSKEELSDFAYKVFFFGIGSISNRVINNIIDETHQPLIELLIAKLEIIQNNYELKTAGSKKVAVPFEDDTTIFTLEIFYFPFDGHSTRLGHYYRHLFQTVSYIANSEVITDRLDKYKYLKLVRAQLSNHEQLLLYYNGLSSFGKEWITSNYFTTYRMIKNIPIGLANFGERPEDKLGVKNSFGEDIFEWL